LLGWSVILLHFSKVRTCDVSTVTSRLQMHGRVFPKHPRASFLTAHWVQQPILSQNIEYENINNVYVGILLMPSHDPGTQKRDLAAKLLGRTLYAYC